MTSRYLVRLVHQESSKTKKSTPSFIRFLFTVSPDMRLYMEYTSLVLSLRGTKSSTITKNDVDFILCSQHMSQVFFFMQNLELVNIWMASNLAGSENQSSQECVSCFLWSWASTRLKWVSGTDYVLFIRIIWVKNHPGIFEFYSFKFMKKTCPGASGNWFLINKINISTSDQPTSI